MILPMNNNNVECDQDLVSSRNEILCFFSFNNLVFVLFFFFTMF